VVKEEYPLHRNFFSPAPLRGVTIHGFDGASNGAPQGVRAAVPTYHREIVSVGGQPMRGNGSASSLPDLVSRLDAQRQRRTGLKPAFTLVEVLVVIGIVAVVAAILLPVLAAARAAGHRAACISNQKQVGAAILLYAQDYDDHFPPVESIRFRTPYEAYWYLLLHPYVRDRSLFACPADTVKPDLSLQGSPPELFFAITPTAVSYGFNKFLGGVIWLDAPGIDSNPYLNKTLGDVTRPSVTVLLADVGAIAVRGVEPTAWPQRPRGGGGRTVLEDANSSGNVMDPDPRVVGPSAPLPRHGGRAVIVFADGHAKALRLETFFTMPGEVAPGETQPGLSPCFRPEKGCP
jgi:prepilin-type N-terminal cleavage/methylation domain-containing protein/prepilin-type processing-associated H-X9-DG protein